MQRHRRCRGSHHDFRRLRGRSAGTGAGQRIARGRSQRIGRRRSARRLSTAPTTRGRAGLRVLRVPLQSRGSAHRHAAFRGDETDRGFRGCARGRIRGGRLAGCGLSASGERRQCRAGNSAADEERTQFAKIVAELMSVGSLCVRVDTRA